MIEHSIDINKVYKSGFDTALVDSGISVLSKKRINRMFGDNQDCITIYEDSVMPPLSNLLSDIDSILKKALNLFAENPGRFKKSMNAHKIAPNQSFKLENLQYLQPAIGAILIMPGNSGEAIKISKIHYDAAGEPIQHESIKSIYSDPRKINMVVFNPSSMIFAYEVPVNKETESVDILTILFEEISHV